MFLYPIGGEIIMKGRTTCPNCNNEFILDIPQDKEKYAIVCPNCNHKFTIKKSIDCKDLEDECVWEERGEPRKTILSSMKPRTDKPMIASIILTFVFIIGLSSAISIMIEQYKDIFINSTFELLPFIGININNYSIFIFSIIIFIFSIIALFGSILSFKRNHLNIAIICAFISIFSIGFFFIGSVLSLVSLIIIVKSREEFINEKKGKIF
jgi:DNA-directed RNA polymerase subunit RPC12/RpoP